MRTNEVGEATLAKLELLAANVVIGTEGSPEIAGVVYDALDDILTSVDPGQADTLLGLATATDINIEEAKKLLKKGFFELGWSWPSSEEAVHMLIIHWLEKIVNGNVGPREGMCDLNNTVLYAYGVSQRDETYVGDSVGMERLMTAHASYDDIYGTPNTNYEPLMPPEEAIREIDQEIRELAQDWLDEHPAIVDRNRRSAVDTRNDNLGSVDEDRHRSRPNYYTFRMFLSKDQRLPRELGFD